ncbi:hypothetical protein [Loktanella salsilacus]|uniref:hypothetical protein n=1 Tax=Loktanella salsilacus TaxID=195913 RepID=UPI0030031F06
MMQLTLYVLSTVLSPTLASFAYPPFVQAAAKVRFPPIPDIKRDQKSLFASCTALE